MIRKIIKSLLQLPRMSSGFMTRVNIIFNRLIPTVFNLNVGDFLDFLPSHSLFSSTASYSFLE